MMSALDTAATGMAAQQYNIDTISNNLANVNTTAFKENQARFQDLIYQTLRAPGSPVGPSVIPVGQDVGMGVKVGSSEKIFTQGTPQQTDNPLDIAIEGDGFFQITLTDGTPAYTRDGSFKRDPNGVLTTADGYLLTPQITIPQNATSVQVGTDGIVTAQIPGQAAPQQLGQIQLVRFQNSAGLAPLGQNNYVQTGASGAPILSQPGLNGAGTLQGGYLESSNVSVVNEMVNLISAQNAYEANSKAISTADTMLTTAVQMKVN
jgi:flagellar basal-body rod protein FlgG